MSGCRLPSPSATEGARDLVTEADLEAQALNVERLRANFPDHAVWAEEGDAATVPAESILKGRSCPRLIFQHRHMLDVVLDADKGGTAKGQQKSGGRLYQGTHSQARIPGVVTVEAPGHPILW